MSAGLQKAGKQKKQAVRSRLRKRKIEEYETDIRLPVQLMETERGHQAKEDH